MSTAKTSPNTSLVLLAGIVSGRILAGLVAILLEMLDRVFRTVHQVERLLQTSCLAAVPVVEAGAAGTGANKSLAAIKARWPFAKGQSSSPVLRPGGAGSASPRNLDIASGQLHAHRDHLLPTKDSVVRFGI